MTRLLSISNIGLVSLSSLGLVLAVAACSSDNTPDKTGTGGSGAVGGGTSGSAGKPPGTGGSTAGKGSGATGGTGGSTGGAGGGTSGSAGSGTSGSAGTVNATGGVGSGGLPGAGAGGGSGGVSPAGGSAGLAGSAGSGMAGTSGSAGTGSVVVNLPPLVTSGPGAYWKTDAMPTDSTATATVTVNDTMVLQNWDGFGGAFNELGWAALSSAALQTQAIALLFSATDGANFAWGRIPMGASDYASSRYTADDTGADPTPNSDESNRPLRTRRWRTSPSLGTE